MSGDPDPSEIATTPEWREDMVAARRRENMGQEELGLRATGRAGQQALISQLETGTVNSSKYILPICDVLRIPPPMHYISATQRKWAKLGHRLEQLKPNQFAEVLSLIQSMVEMADAAATAKAQANATLELPQPKKARPIGSATIGLPSAPLRSSSDTLPFEEPKPRSGRARKKRS